MEITPHSKRLMWYLSTRWHEDGIKGPPLRRRGVIHGPSGCRVGPRTRGGVSHNQLVMPIGAPESGPDLAALISAYRQQAPSAPTGAAPSSPAVAPIVPQPQVSLSGVDGPRPGAIPAMTALQSVLQTSLAQAGPVDQIAQRLIDRFAGALPAPATAPPAVSDLSKLLPTEPMAQRQQLTRALTSLIATLDQPAAVASRCADLGSALHHLGLSPQRLDALGMLMADALRAGAGADWRPEYRGAWEKTARLVTAWMGQGVERAAYEPPFWAAEVVEHDRRGANTAVLRARTYLPYPCRPGQYAIVESAHHPQVWRPCWIANLPAADNVVALHVDALPTDEVGTALVESTVVGDRLRLRPAQGELALDSASDRDIVMVAHGVGIAPMKAMLYDLRQYRQACGVYLLWSVDTPDDFYDMAEVLAIAGPDTTLVPVVLGDSADQMADIIEDFEWSEHDIYVSGSYERVGATLAILAAAQVPAERIHYSSLEAEQAEESAGY
jgi:NAD(P)H-flavin reductase